jgi:hypothetical protein
MEIKKCHGSCGPQLAGPGITGWQPKFGMGETPGGARRHLPDHSGCRWQGPVGEDDEQRRWSGGENIWGGSGVSGSSPVAVHGGASSQWGIVGGSSCRWSRGPLFGLEGSAALVGAPRWQRRGGSMARDVGQR